MLSLFPAGGDYVAARSGRTLAAAAHWGEFANFLPSSSLHLLIAPASNRHASKLRRRGEKKKKKKIIISTNWRQRRRRQEDRLLPSPAFIVSARAEGNARRQLIRVCHPRMQWSGRPRSQRRRQALSIVSNCLAAKRSAILRVAAGGAGAKRARTHGLWHSSLCVSAARHCASLHETNPTIARPMRAKTSRAQLSLRVN